MRKAGMDKYSVMLCHILVLTMTALWSLKLT